MASTISYYIITANVVVAGNVATITPTAITTDTGAAVSGTLAGFVQAGGTVYGGGCSAPIASVSAAGVITTAPVWTGASGDGLTLTVQMVPRGTNTYQSSVSAIAAVNELNDAAAAGTRVMDTDAAGSLTNIDALIDCYLVRMDLTVAPAAITRGACYLVADGATGDWAGYDGKIAVGISGGWKYLTPYNGLTVYNAAEKKFYFYENETFLELTEVLAAMMALAGAKLTKGAYLRGNDSGAAAEVDADTVVSDLGLKIGEKVQAYSDRLTALAKLTKSAGLARQDADGNWTIDATAYLSALTGDVTTDSAGAATIKKIGGHAVSVSGASTTDGTLYSLSFTLSGNSAVTFPTSGTLAVLEQAQTWTAYQTVDITGAAYHNLRGSTTETFYNVYNAAMPSGSRNWRFGCNTGTGTLCIDALNDAGSSVTGRVTMSSSGVLGSNALKFPATQVVSSDANTLDDYEEGTGSVAISATGSAPTCTYNFNSLVYRKIGDTVWIRFGIKLASISGGSGGVIITGLPFTSAYFGSYKNPTARVETGWLTTAANAPNVRIYVSDSSTFLGTRLIDNADNSLDVSQLTANTFIGGEIFYQVA